MLLADRGRLICYLLEDLSNQGLIHPAIGLNHNRYRYLLGESVSINDASRSSPIPYSGLLPGDVDLQLTSRGSVYPSAPLKLGSDIRYLSHQNVAPPPDLVPAV